MPRLNGALLLAAALLLVGCEKRETLYTGLSQTEVNEMLSLLYASNLPAEKMLVEDDTYSLTTPKASFTEAMTLLQAHGLPGDDFESMGDIFEKESFVSSRLEERARLNYALSQELARTIADIDGVVRARVHLVMPERERLRQRTNPASASVYVRHRADVDLTRERSKIKSIVINGVENLPYRNVSVALFETGTPTGRVYGVQQAPTASTGQPALVARAVIQPAPLLAIGLIVGLLTVLLLRRTAVSSAAWSRRFPWFARTESADDVMPAANSADAVRSESQPTAGERA